MEMKRRLLYIPVFHIDANLINARQRLPAVNQLEKWFSDGVILIDMSGTARTEAKAGNDGQRDRKANRHGAQTDSQRNDVKIVAGAAKYQAILVTADGASKSQPGGILGNRDKLKGRVRIVSPDEAVTLVREKILEREDFNQQMAREYGLQLGSAVISSTLVRERIWAREGSKGSSRP